MTSAVTVRKMEEDDLDEVLAIEASSSLTPWSRSLFLGEMTHPHGHCLSLILRGGAGPLPVAYLCFRTVGDESELLNLAVHPDHRRRGFARHLMTFYLDLCRRDKVRKSFLDVSTENHAALHLYRSLGYRGIGTRTRFYLGRLDALVMEREIGTKGAADQA